MTSGTYPGSVTVIGDHDQICGGIAPAAVAEEADQITYNIYSVERLLMSDLNGDGEIDIFDLVRVASRFGSDDPTADINGDGLVDIFDLTIVAGSFGQRLPGLKL